MKWKKFTHDGKPNFDVDGFHKPLVNGDLNWKDLTTTSSEMMEFFYSQQDIKHYLDLIKKVQDKIQHGACIPVQSFY